MKILNVVGTAIAYMLAGVSFVSGLTLVGILWLILGVANQFVTIMW